MHRWFEILGKTSQKVGLARLGLLCFVLLTPHTVAAVEGGTVHWDIAVESFQKGDYAKALNNLSYVLGHPEFTTPFYRQKALILRGQCLEKINKPAAATKSYMMALKQYGANEEAFLLLGDMYLRYDNPEAAVKALRGALSMNHDNAKAHEGLAAAYLALGRLEEAKANMDAAAALGVDVDYLRKRLNGEHRGDPPPSASSDK